MYLTQPLRARYPGLCTPSKATFARSFTTPSAACACVTRLTQIPLLDEANLDDLMRQAQSPEGRSKGVLVRWCCMVQDTGVRVPLTQLGCELFLGTLKAGAQTVCGLYGAESRVESTEETDASPKNMAERLVLCGVSMPGESAWAHQLRAGSDEMSTALAQLALDRDPSSKAAQERNPIGEQPKVTALVKFADVDRAEQLHTAELIEVLGLLDTSFLPNPDLPIEGYAEENLAQIPCIHALCFDRFNTGQLLLPLLHSAALTTPTSSTLEESRASLIAYLAQHLGGDALAAEFVLLAVLAKMYVAR